MEKSTIIREASCDRCGQVTVAGTMTITSETMIGYPAPPGQGLPMAGPPAGGGLPEGWKRYTLSIGSEASGTMDLCFTCQGEATLADLVKLVEEQKAKLPPWAS